MSTFQAAIEHTLKHEGFLSNDRYDPGGITKYGISLRFLRTVGEELGDVDKDGDIDAEDIKALSRPQAIELYRREFWLKNKYDRIESPELAAKVFDTCVNTGPVQAHKILQRALVDKGQQVAIDGKIGTQTLLAVNLQGSNLLPAYSDNQAGFYIDLTKQRCITYGVEPGMKYLRGWIRRAYWIPGKEVND